MAKRGRPRKNGVKQGWVLFRAILALSGYHNARMAGEKHSEALKAGVAEVRKEFPGMPVSQTVVKRALAEFQSKAQPLALVVSERESTDNVAVDGSHWKRTLNLGLGPRPNYPRHNASSDESRKRRHQPAVVAPPESNNQ